ncbi:hypothetical protein D3C81_2133500 [compost metagenome]
MGHIQFDAWAELRFHLGHHPLDLVEYQRLKHVVGDAQHRAPLVEVAHLADEDIDAAKAGVGDEVDAFGRIDRRHGAVHYFPGVLRTHLNLH